MKIGSIYIGIGGWTFEPWRGVFYPEKLTQAKGAELASKLTSIEINGTYYGSQKPESFRKWAGEVPDGFVFSLKGPRFATNLRKSSQRPATKHFHFADRACYRREQLETTTRNFTMKYAFALLGAAALLASFSGASAQTAEPTYKADPDVYKIIYEDEKVRIIESTRKAGVTDKLHGHPVKSIVYGVTQCKTEQTADGKTTETDTKPGTARALPVIPAHTAKNIGSEDCKQLFVEEK